MVRSGERKVVEKVDLCRPIRIRAKVRLSLSCDASTAMPSAVVLEASGYLALGMRQAEQGRGDAMRMGVEQFRRRLPEAALCLLALLNDP